jgi:hypothetical protein
MVLYIYTCCSHLEHRASVKHFISLQFLNLQQSVGLLEWRISLKQGCYLHRMTQTQNKCRQTDIHALHGIQTHDPSVQVGKAISCFSLCSCCDWHIMVRKYLIKNCQEHSDTWKACS